MADALLAVEGLTKRFGGILASDNIALDVKQGELHAIIGPNGAGKTTLIGQLTGMLTPTPERCGLPVRTSLRCPPMRAVCSAWRARSRSPRCF